jgi:hypothetical protein
MSEPHDLPVLYRAPDGSLAGLHFDPSPVKALPQNYQATYLDFWLQLVGVRDLRSVIVDNAWNRDRQESEVSLAKGKATLERLVEWFLNQQQSRSNVL